MEICVNKLNTTWPRGVATRAAGGHAAVNSLEDNPSHVLEIDGNRRRLFSRFIIYFAKSLVREIIRAEFANISLRMIAKYL
jgi:hypothetical protein